VSDFVIDASVAVKWIIDEEGTAQALALRGRSLAAPDLLIAECANVLWKMARRGQLSQPEAVFAAGLLARADIELMPMRPYLEAATRMSIELDHPAYDCVYIALAEAEGIPFVTADERLLRKVARRPPRLRFERVLRLGDIGLASR